jgi:tetrahydrodipicolinate N-succinyltransferase
VASASSRFKHISNKVLENFPETLALVIEDSKQRQAQFMLSTQTPVNDPMETIDVFSKQFGLSQIETEVVRQSFYLESGATMFHIINAFTRAAQEPNLSTVDAYRLERTGGQILGLIQ